ncbi:m7GpppX diphosphatase [Anopheles bellator]|uniref:m7GpppX diphosphatase n=1 Tax=Anopheles bellator TaxID=139047 RepID=UPI002647FC9A|nr:m7GpppX diphosphatase [Anopheles bellator]
MLEATNQAPSETKNSKTTHREGGNAVGDSHSQRHRHPEGQQPTDRAGEICYDLAHFRTERVLSNNSTHKSVSLLGHFANLPSPKRQAIVVLEKRAFAEAEVSSVDASATPTQRDKQPQPDSESENGSRDDEKPVEKTKANTVESERTFFTSSSQLEKEFVNDIYGNFLCTVNPALNRLKVTIIYPAEEKHIVKYTVQNRFLVEETPDLYKSVTLPHLEQGQLSLEWLYNVLDHRKEKERIVYEDPCNVNGFILVPDLKWDGKTVEQLYLLALVRRRDIRSLRDLTAEHLPLLRNVQARGISAIEERYGIGADQLRIYLHYQPTFYHLHMHFTYLRHDPPGVGCEKAHLLSSVISNIELLPDYYQRSTLTYALKETDRLYEKIRVQTLEEPAAKRPKTDHSKSE